MANNKHHDEDLERMMNHLADSVLTLPDDAILAEARENGADAEEQAERTRFVLQHASRVLGNLNRRLSNLGHMLGSKSWRHGAEEYHNECLNCGSPVSFTTTGEMRGTAFYTPCSDSGQYVVAKRRSTS